MVFLTYIPFYLPSPGTWRAQSASAKLPSLLFRRCVTTHGLVGLAQLLCAAAALSCCYRDVNATVVCCWRAVNIWHPHGPKSTRGPPVSRQFGITIVQELRFSSVKWVREKLEKKFEMLYFFFFVCSSSKLRVVSVSSQWCHNTVELWQSTCFTCNTGKNKQTR